MDQNNNLPLLLTPGPLTTSDETRQALERDWGSRDNDFIGLTSRVRHRLAALVGGGDDEFVAVPLQGSGTFVVEATLGTMMPRDGKMLVLINGAYGRRMAQILDIMGRAYTTLERAEDEAITGEIVGQCAIGRHNDHPRRRGPLRNDVGHFESHRRHRDHGRRSGPLAS